MTALIRDHLLRAQSRMKMQEDKHRSDRVFHPGDWVFLKLQPYMQQSVSRRSNHKLGFKFFGPYQVLARVGAVSYLLALPPSSKIHPVVHVSLLKPADPPVAGTDTGDSLQYAAVATQASRPVQVLQSRLVRFGGGTRRQYKIAWSGLPLTMATWEWSSALPELASA
uniref:Tf2-1-like SH3-like domain-containing protein n=1 Tax=Triticum urartu TaxID=4572 RepID=A0A8R7UTR2_TRIUA